MPTEFWILDTETASLQGGVCEIAWLRVNDKLDILEEFVSRVNPEREIQEGARAIHGISDADVADKPTLAELCANLSKPLMVIGHNVGFDLRMTAPHITAAGSLCTLALSRQYIKGTTNHKLPTLKAELGLPERDSHSALADVHTVRDLLLHILPLTGRSLDTLFTLSSGPKVVHRMPFGKYKGKMTMDVPPDYRKWLLNQEGLDQDIRYTFEKMKGIL